MCHSLLFLKGSESQTLRACKDLKYFRCFNKFRRVGNLIVQRGLEQRGFLCQEKSALLKNALYKAL